MFREINVGQNMLSHMNKYLYLAMYANSCNIWWKLYLMIEVWLFDSDKELSQNVCFSKDSVKPIDSLVKESI